MKSGYASWNHKRLMNNLENLMFNLVQKYKTKLDGSKIRQNLYVFVTQ